MESAISESDLVKARYKRRSKDDVVALYSLRYWPFIHWSRAEREYFLGAFLQSKFEDLREIRVLEVGAGTGDNLIFFKRLGVLEENITAIELLPDRASVLRSRMPRARVIEGDALSVELNEQFDFVYQSTVFTSILDQKIHDQLARKMVGWARRGGIIGWYDFTFNNPKNPDVMGISKSATLSLFANEKLVFLRRITLAPPIARRVQRLYNFLNFPFLRTHLLAFFEKS